jgi:hypothetical protein
MDIQVAKLEKGTKVYQVDGTVIRGLFISRTPKDMNIFILLKMKA